MRQVDIKVDQKIPFMIRESIEYYYPGDNPSEVTLINTDVVFLRKVSIDS